MTDVAAAVEALGEGNPVLVFDADDREGEVDLVQAASTVSTNDVVRMRNDAGGLVCTALEYDVAEAFDLPYLEDSIAHPASDDLNLPYDARSSFSLSVNHRDTFTGITDQDRARTITALGTAAADPAETDFAAEFRAPGHVSILKEAPNGLSDRRGHTELGLALTKAAGFPVATVVCEMLDDETGQALSVADGRRYANEHGLRFVDGGAVLRALG